MSLFLNNLVYNFLVAFGVIVGASTFAGVGAIINDQPPLKTMLDMANSTKVWAIAVALGGTFSSFEIIEKGLFKGEIKSIIRQAAYIIMAVLGANSGSILIRMIKRCSELWLK